MLKKVCAWLVGRIGYLLYTLVLVVVVLWIFFPQETANRLLVRYLNSAFPQLNWQVDSLTLQLPEGVVLGTIRGYDEQDTTKPLVRVDAMTLRPNIAGMLKTGKLQAVFDILLAKGVVTGTLLPDGAKTGLRIEGTVRGVQLAEFSVLTRSLHRDVQGTVSAIFSGIMQPSMGRITEIEATLSVDNGRFALKQPVLEHTGLPFSRVTMMLHGKRETLRLEQGTVESKLFNGNFAGEIKLNQDPAASLLNISGTLQPGPDFFKGVNNAAVLQVFRAQFKSKPLPFQVSGDFRNPGIHFEEFSKFFQALDKELK